MAKISNVKLPDGNTYDIRAASIPFGQVDSTSTSTAYTATVPGITELTDGVCCYLMNGVVTSEANFTINVNGLGAKPSYNNLAAATRDTTIFNVNYTFLFVYNSTRVSGGCWDCYRGYDANTNTIGYQLRTNSTSLKMKSVTYRYRLLFTSDDGKYWVPANNSSSTNATSSRTVCQDKIDPWGRIVYYGATASVAANARPSATVLWDQYLVTLGYSFNKTGAALTLTSWSPVYVKCAPQTDGSAIIDSTTPYVQELPSTDDGKIYIFLGVAISATQIELVPNHPVYYYKDGSIRLWTNSAASATSEVYLQEINGTVNFNDIVAARSAGKVIIGYTDQGLNIYDYFILTSIAESGRMIFSSVNAADDAIYGNTYNWDSTNGWVNITSGVHNLNGVSPIVTTFDEFEMEWQVKHQNSGVDGGTYGSASAVPVITVDDMGHITNVTTAAISGADTKVTNTLETTTKYYVTGTTSNTTNTGTQVFDTGIYVTTTAGQLNATTYKVNENVTLQWNATDQSLDFIF